MFGHRQFLSSFWIRWIIRFTVSIILSSFGLWVRGFLLRPHGGLKSGSCWSLFIWCTPVHQSLQEYLGVLVVFSSVLKGNLSWLSWGSDFWTYWTRHREQYAETLESSDPRDISNQRNVSNQALLRLRLESRVGNPISHSHLFVTLGYTQEVLFLYWNYGHDMKPIGWYSYRVRVKFSLVLLGMFRHQLVQLWCSAIPIRIVIWENPSVLSGKLEFLLFRHLHPLKTSNE